MVKREHALGSLLGCLLIALATLCVSANCQDADDDAEWSLPIYEEGCSSLMIALHQEWVKADGEGVYDVERKLFWALLLDPNAFYHEFAPDTVNYNRFSEDLQHLVFWSHIDTTTAHLERQRVVAIERLVDQTYSIDSNYIELHKELIDLLTIIRSGYVD